jgi:hypothetical protein
LLSFNVKKFILITNTRSQNLCGNKKVEINWSQL